MATTKTTIPDGSVYDVRPFNSLEIKQWYDSSDEYTDGIDTTTFLSSLATLISTFKDGYPFASEEAFDTAADTLESDITSALNANVAAPTFHDIMDVVNADMIGLIESDTTTNPPSGLTYVCPECLGNGKKQVLNADGTGTGTYVRSTLCNGYGATASQYVRDPAAGFIEEP